jgi:hypothetical protein
MAAACPDHTATLLAQFRNATVTKRTNSGAGFWTDFTVDRTTAPPVPLTEPLGATGEIDGFVDPILFVLFMKGGYAVQIEGAAIRDDTSAVDFSTVNFAIR